MYNKRLKITKKDYDKLSGLILDVMDNYQIKAYSAYIEKCSLTRYLWNIYFFVSDTNRKNNRDNYLFMRGLYKYMNDNNTESALRAILSDYI